MAILLLCKLPRDEVDSRQQHFRTSIQEVEAFPRIFTNMFLTGSKNNIFKSSNLNMTENIDMEVDTD